MSISGSSNLYNPSVFSSPSPQTSAAKPQADTQNTSTANNQNNIMSVVLPLVLQVMTMLLQGITGNMQGQQPQQSSVNFNDNDSIAQRLQQLNGGNPQVNQLLTQAFNFDPSSPEAQQSEARIAALWTGSQSDLQQTFALLGIGELNNLSGSLNTISTNLDPNSAEFQQVQTRIAAINTQRDGLIQQVQQFQGS